MCHSTITKERNLGQGQGQGHKSIHCAAHCAAKRIHILEVRVYEVKYGEENRRLVDRRNQWGLTYRTHPPHEVLQSTPLHRVWEEHDDVYAWPSREVTLLLLLDPCGSVSCSAIFRTVKCLRRRRSWGHFGRWVEWGLSTAADRRASSRRSTQVTKEHQQQHQQWQPQQPWKSEWELDTCAIKTKG